MSSNLSRSSGTTNESLDTLSEYDTMDHFDSVGGTSYDPLGKLIEKFNEDPSQFLWMSYLMQFHNDSSNSKGPFLLPSRDVKDIRKTLVLDMDETLVHCFFQQADKPHYDWSFTLDRGTYMLNVFCRVRPHLEEFLRLASEMYEIVVFTASQERYANKVLDLIDPMGYVQHRLFQQHCTCINGAYVKDLSLLGRPLDRTVILDNSLISFAFQPMNGIPCGDWFGDHTDDELLQLIPMLQLLFCARDVRLELLQIFGLDDFLFGMYGSPSVDEESCWSRAKC